MRREKDGSPAAPEDFELSMITSDKKRLTEIHRGDGCPMRVGGCGVRLKMSLGGVTRKISVRSALGKDVIRPR